MRKKIIDRAICALLLVLLLASLGSCTQRPAHKVTIIRGGEIVCGCRTCAGT